MLKRLLYWFVLLFLSLVSSRLFGWPNLGKTFFSIYLLANLLMIVLLAFLIFSDQDETNDRLTLVAGFISTLLFIICSIGVSIILSAVSASFFNVDFYVAFQILTLGTCIASEKNNSDEESEDDSIDNSNNFTT